MTRVSCPPLTLSSLVFLAGAELKIVYDFQVQHPDQPVYNALVQASGKLVLIDKLLPKLKENGHKVCACVYCSLLPKLKENGHKVCACVYCSLLPKLKENGHKVCACVCTVAVYRN